MNPEDIQSLNQIGQALWANSEQSRKATIDAVSAVSLLSLTPTQALERASAALVERATRDGTRANASALHLPFFRLSSQERFLLVALHLERWSYARTAAVLEVAPAKVETMAWKLRTLLDAQVLKGSAGRGGATGNPPKTASCPSFDALTPWTQKFLDEEYGAKERVFLQNHLMACDSCRDSLSRCRALYFRVEAILPRADSSQNDSLIQVYTQLRHNLNPHERPLKAALAIFLRRTEVQLVLAGALTLLAVKIFQLG